MFMPIIEPITFGLNQQTSSKEYIIKREYSTNICKPMKLYNVYWYRIYVVLVKCGRNIKHLFCEL